MLLTSTEMKQLPLILMLLLICAGGYLRVVQPKDWNDLLDSLKASGGKSTTGAAGSTETEAEAAPPVPKPSGVEYITPSTTSYLHSSHIVDVPQPPQPKQSSDTNQAASTPPVNKVFIPPNPLPSQAAWTWTTPDGKIYKNVIIQKVEADRVTIYHDQGSAVLDIYLLNPDLQKQLNFDPDLAADAIAAREKAAKDTANPPGP